MLLIVMKKRLFAWRCAVLVAFLGVMGRPAAGQDRPLSKEVTTDRYERNSVCLMMMEDASVPQKDILRKAFLEAGWNNKYNNHNLGVRIMDPDLLRLDAEDVAAFDMACTPNGLYFDLKASGAPAPAQTFYNENMSQILRSLMAEVSQTVDTVIQLNAARMANKFLVEQHIAKQCVDKWFFDGQGNYTEALIEERGLLEASAGEVAVANASVAQRQKLLREKCDLNELMENTFVVVTRFSYKDKDGVINDRMLPLEALAQCESSGYAGLGVSMAKMAIKASVGAGYYVAVDSYLFRLRWNEALTNEFYSLWNENGEFDRAKYDAADFAALQFIGNEREWVRTKAGIFTDKSEEELIRMAAVEAVDAVLAKFERKYDQFKTKTPLCVREEEDRKGRIRHVYGVRLGTRDGLKGGEVFEVLEKKVEQLPDGTQQVSYNKKGELTVSKKNVWDNMFVPGTEEAAARQDGMTLLVGRDKKAYYEGLLLRMKTKK